VPEQPVTGVELHGEEPKRLSLSDRSRLSLDPESRSHGPVRWKRVGGRGCRRPDEISVRDARELAGEGFDGYVAVRTRAEAGWMRAVADWYREQADRLEGELDAPA
jgi:hypothetical protein